LSSLNIDPTDSQSSNVVNVLQSPVLNDKKQQDASIIRNSCKYLALYFDGTHEYIKAIELKINQHCINHSFC